MPDPIHVRFTKWDGSLHWHFDMTRLGEDRHGVWLGAPDGTELRRGSDLTRMSPPFAVVLPRTGYWSAAFNVAVPSSRRPEGWPVVATDVEPFGYDIYVDVCTPPVWDGSTVTAIDLDLDVVRPFGGPPEIHDEDEFDEHRTRYGYPDDVVTAARAAAEATRRSIASGAEPFVTVGPAWLAQAIDLG
jgi:uncharacterized protein